MLELVRMEAKSCISFHLEPLSGPFRPQNWRIAKLDVLAKDYGAARDKANQLKASGAHPPGFRALQLLGVREHRRRLIASVDEREKVVDVAERALADRVIDRLPLGHAQPRDGGSRTA